MGSRAAPRGETATPSNEARLALASHRLTVLECWRATSPVTLAHEAFTMTINWTASIDDADKMFAIATRAWRSPSVRDLYNGNKLTLLMDLNACHCNGTPLRLADFVAAGDGDFFHDVAGIAVNMDRETGSSLAKCWHGSTSTLPSMSASTLTPLACCTPAKSFGPRRSSMAT